MKSLYKVITFLLLLLGIIHEVATPLFYATLTIDTVWFIGGGLVLILTALINFINMMTYSSKVAVRYICNMSNVVGLAYTILIVMCLSKPQAFIAFLLLLSETVIAFIFKPKAKMHIYSEQ